MKSTAIKFTNEASNSKSQKDLLVKIVKKKKTSDTVVAQSKCSYSASLF